MPDLISYTKEYEVNSLNINTNKRLGLFGLLGMLQDISSIHAEKLNLGMEYMIKNNSFWVLVQQKLEMNDWPHWQDTIELKTWPTKPFGKKINRIFEVYQRGIRIGRCITTYMVLDGEARKAITPKLPEVFIEKLDENKNEDILERISLPDNFTTLAQFSVRNSDLDMNNHVNNTKYSQWILDSIPFEFHHKSVLKEFEINFLLETHLGDSVDIQVAKIGEAKGPNVHRYFKGIRHSDQKTVFTAKLIADVD